MTIIYEERRSDSPYIETVTRGWTANDGSPVRPAEIHWHMVLSRHNSHIRFLLVGPLSTSGVALYKADAEILWIKLKLGAYMPHLPTRRFLDTETTLPVAAGQSFWLKGSAWQFPDYDNVETFIGRLVREQVLVRDPVVDAVLQGRLPEISPRTLRHRFLHTTGLAQGHIHQFERAQRAVTLLQQGGSILDTVVELGYFDQPHLTRSLKRFIGRTPAEILHLSQPADMLE